MQRYKLPLARLSLAQKLDLMETLWTDLTRDDKTFESPAWHEAVLAQRAKAFSGGKATASDWREAKERIRKKVS